MKGLRPLLGNTPSCPDYRGGEAIRYALETQDKWGVPAAVTLAQFGKESSYGHSHLFKSSNNPFGMHAVRGQDYIASYDRDADGNLYPAKYRKFKSLEEAFDEHGRLLATGRAYAEARRHLDNPDAYANALTGHYAEDRHYGESLIHDYMHLLKRDA